MRWLSWLVVSVSLTVRVSAGLISAFTVLGALRCAMMGLFKLHLRNVVSKHDGATQHGLHFVTDEQL